MSILTISNLSLSFLEQKIFKKIGLQIETEDRIGLIGPNGSGKTTLLKLINNEISPDEGLINKSKGLRIGYLSQDMHSALSGTIHDCILYSITGRKQLRNNILHTEKLLSEALEKSELQRLAEMVAQLHNEMAYLDMQFPSHDAESILEGLGFHIQDFSRTVSILSEGWKIRLQLACLLYQRPDLLLLDEPTNHLDVPSVHWLDKFLQTFKGAIVLVSHDRDFLNRQVNRIISLEPEGMRSYKGDYEFYLKARDEENSILLRQKKNQEQKIRDAQKFIERFRHKATKARQAQSKIKLLKKIEIVEGHKTPKTIHFSFPDVVKSGREVLTIKNLSKGFNNKVLYTNLNMNVFREERIAIIGPNGSGKTTLLKIIANEIKPDDGEIIIGHNVITGYFAQHHMESLDNRKTVIEEVSQAAPNESISFLRGICGAFLFSGDDVDKPVGVLSGGEKARVSLAKLLVSPGNLMLMDEPTNHLDLISSEKLINALTSYKGTLLFVSHNHSFVNRLATKIWDITEKGIEEYPGNLNDYFDHLERNSKTLELDNHEKHLEQSQPKEKKNRKTQKRLEAENRKRISDSLKPIQDKINTLEKRIAGLEHREKELEQILSNPAIFADSDKGPVLLSEYRDIKEKIKELLARWEYGQEHLEKTKKSLGINA